MLDRDPHGNVRFMIETEKLLIDVVKEVEEKKRRIEFDGKFSGQSLLRFRDFVYPSFDADYCFSLVYPLIVDFRRQTGYMASVNLTKRLISGCPVALPITMMMNMEKRHGAMKPVIQALVDLKGKPFNNWWKTVKIGP